MSRRSLRQGSLVSLLVAVFATACGGDDAPAADTTPTFTRVTQEVITAKTCGGAGCHTAPIPLAGFNLTTPTKLHDLFVGVKATGPECGTSDLDRVVANDPEKSLLYLKIRHGGAVPCGDAMPPTTEPLSDAQVELVRAWIEAGAKND